MAAHDSLRRVRLYEVYLRFGLERFVDACAALPCLESVKLVYTHLERSALPQLARLLTACRTLTDLDINEHSDFIVGDGVAAFCSALADAPALQTLSLHMGMITVSSTQEFHDAATGEAVLAALRQIPTFKTLKINNVTHEFGA